MRSGSETLLFSLQICGFADRDTKEICRLIIANLWIGTPQKFTDLQLRCWKTKNFADLQKKKKNLVPRLIFNVWTRITITQIQTLWSQPVPGSFNKTKSELHFLYSAGSRQLWPNNPPGNARHVIANIAQGPVAGKYPTTSLIRSHFTKNYLKVSKINIRQVSFCWKYRCLFRKKEGFTSKHTRTVSTVGWW